MSVLLTGGKNAITRLDERQAARKKDERKKLSSHSMSHADHVVVPPPFSDDRTSVWYWALDGVMTTVMFNKTNLEVWCNGKTLQTTLKRMRNSTDADTMASYSIDFRFQYLSHKDVAYHLATIRPLHIIHQHHATTTSGLAESTASSRLSCNAANRKFNLYVDGHCIDEHTGSSGNEYIRFDQMRRTQGGRITQRRLSAEGLSMLLSTNHF